MVVRCYGAKPRKRHGTGQDLRGHHSIHGSRCSALDVTLRSRFVRCSCLWRGVIVNRVAIARRLARNHAPQ